MILNENITAYLHSLQSDNPKWLEDIRCMAEDSGVPIIRREMEPFINVLLHMLLPGRILEIGTGVGYSALFMNECLEGVKITTIENYEPRLLYAEKNLKGRDNITLIKADASQAIKELTGPFDFIFLDGAKGQYGPMYSDLKRLLSPGAVLLADNILQDGELIRSRYVIPRRQRTIHKRMRDFVWTVMHDPELESSVLTIADGVILSVRK